MATQTASLVQALERLHILEPTQQREVAQQLSGRFPAAAALAGELVQRGWLTHFQVDKLLQGQGDELLLGPYVLLDQLGQGAAGQVYKARLQSTGKVVALKVLRKEMVADPEAVARFHREMEVASQLKHPCIVRASDAGQVGDSLVLEMEYLQGIDLEALVRKSGPLPVLAACDYIRQAALGLQHAYKRGLIHRDIKPANLFVCKYKIQDPAIGTTPYGLVKIFDLGLARLQAPPPGSQTRNLTQLAGLSVMQGTPDYMAPEQALDFHSADIRSDIYSLGCTFYFLLAGKPPFSGSLPEKLIKHQQAMPTPIEEVRPKVAQPLPAILRKMIAKRPIERFQTPGEVAEALAKHFPSQAKGPARSAAAASSSSSGEFMFHIPEAARGSAGPPSGLIPRGGRIKKLYVVAPLALLVVASGLAWWFLRGTGDKTAASSSRPTLPTLNTLATWTPPTSVGPSTATRTSTRTKTGEGRLFEKADQAVEVPHGDSLEPAQLTLAAWVKLADFPDNRRWIVSKNPNEWAEGHYALVIEGRKVVVYLNIGNGRANMREARTGDVLEPNRWHHLAMTYDGQTLRGYLDGNSFGQTTINKPRVPGKAPLVIGRRPDKLADSHFLGRLDDIRLYDRALSASEVLALFNQPDARARKGEGGLVLVWP